MNLGFGVYGSRKHERHANESDDDSGHVETAASPHCIRVRGDAVLGLRWPALMGRGWCWVQSWLGDRDILIHRWLGGGGKRKRGYCAPGTIAKRSGYLISCNERRLMLGLWVWGDGRRGEHTTEESRKGIHCENSVGCSVRNVKRVRFRRCFFQTESDKPWIIYEPDMSGRRDSGGVLGG